MIKWRSGLIFLTALLFIMIISACGNNSEGGSSKSDGSNQSGEKAGSKTLSILTGGTGGTYYPLGGSMAQIISEETDFNANAQSSGASAENMQALKNGEADIAFSQTDIAAYALNGELMFKDNKVDNVKAIGTLYPETVQIITTKDSGILSVEDLKGKSVSVGAPGSGVNANAQQILEIHGLSFDDIKAQSLSFDESTDSIQSGSIDAAFITAGIPTAAVESLSAQKEIRVIPIADDKIKQLIEKYPYYAEDTVPKGTYKIPEDVKTVAVKAMLVVRGELDEDAVYNITKAIFENTNKITHAKGKLIKAETALDGIGDLPLHPGAEKYFSEKGVQK
ncbi:TAXI family TRAP transporter solute-binding subunit [Aeribacillus pallidus]|uniref:C4-dicarboxylate ABC transporter substrate-binding protein n=1 Tax=Aeribacillus pallidus TaxID=33936 RepID=A0A223E5M2_9BACI|nr:TAXI family TRAP transporter solute-binding subunit [Aeribacillus pallidus]ASS90572.1 C4-dicarboxylate ABC transporter substrate-binding protein [Aeribacillus pallidus]